METPAPRRGTLTVYLGAAPGVGKTYAMLSEAARRRDRGTDVVVGLVETHGRPRTAEMLAGLEVVPRRTIEYRGSTFTEMDTEAIIARHPEVVYVDELAHTNVPGSPRDKRVQDVELLRRAGIDVVTTVNIQHLESLNDAVASITGTRQRETVPDDLVRNAEQIQLVDMAPDALRRRMAHGNVYRADQIDASLGSYFRVGNLTALRELALLWLADRVDDALGDYRQAHGIAATWPAKERIIVAVTGGPESESLIRRGARLAQRSAGADLLVLHVIADDGITDRDDAKVGRLQQLVASIGGSFHTVAGERVAEAVVDFATGVNASMIVVGVSRHGAWRRFVAGATGERIASLAGSIDVHLVTHGEVPRTRGAHRRLSPLSSQRQRWGLVLAVLLPLALTAVLRSVDDPDQLPLDVSLFLAATVLVALVGGRVPALVTAALGFVLMNWFFTPPTGELSISQPANLVALVVFVAVAVAVASVVDRASRRAADALRARTESATMSALSRSVLTGQDTAEAIVDRVRETFGQSTVSLVQRSPDGWVAVATSGIEPAVMPEDADTRVTVDETHVITLHGPLLRASDQRVLDAFAVQTGIVLEYRRLRDAEERTTALERAEATSTAILRAVSHDLRTPLATMHTAVDGLADATVGTADRAELVTAITDSMAQLEHLIDDLLDLSRLQSGLVRPLLKQRSLDEVLPLAVAGHPRGTVVLELDETMPWVLTDAALLERVVANVVDNAVRAASRTEHPLPVRVAAHALADRVEIWIVDQGPGLPAGSRERMFEPFQRLGDTGGSGLGLGLAVAGGLTEVIGGTITAEDTPGGGLTMIVSLPRADAATGADHD